MSEDRTTPNGEAPQAPPPSRALKIAVYGMGVAIAVMTALLVLGLALGWNKKSVDTASGGNPVVSVPRVETGETEGGVPDGGPAPLNISVPKDAAIYTITGDGRLVALHVRSPGGDEVIVVDTAKNAVVSRIRLVPGP